jgi:2-iminobutanoate/2-iminopropanoate deaminase
MDRRDERPEAAMTNPTKVQLEAVHPKPEEAAHMPYAPAVRIVGACDLMFISGATPSPLYHRHPHVEAEHVHPHDIGEQTRRAMDSIKLVLDQAGASFRDVVKVTKYLTDIRDFDGMHAAMAPYFGEWRPASTTLCVNQLSSPGARVELDMIVALPKKM